MFNTQGLHFPINARSILTKLKLYYNLSYNTVRYSVHYSITCRVGGEGAISDRQPDRERVRGGLMREICSSTQTPI